MRMNIDRKIDELFLLLDNHCDIKKITELKSKITSQELELITEFRNNPTIINKKKLYDNEIIKAYLTCESNINYLIMEINNKFKRSRSHACHKW